MKTTNYMRNSLFTLYLISVACFAVTALGIGPTWATWYIGQYSALAVILASCIYCIGYIVRAISRAGIKAISKGMATPTRETVTAGAA